MNMKKIEKLEYDSDRMANADNVFRKVQEICEAVNNLQPEEAPKGHCSKCWNSPNSLKHTMGTCGVACECHNLQPREEEWSCKWCGGRNNTPPKFGEESKEECPVCKKEEPHWHEGVGWKMTHPVKQEPLSELEEYCKQQLEILYKNQYMDTMGDGYANAMNDVLEKIKHLPITGTSNQLWNEGSTRSF